jgi:8-hydroxy-5-deazaflavin:NADPH oxidoreductase
MKIAVLGAGKIGGTLGEKWARRGHTVMFGVRRPDDPDLRNRIRPLGQQASLGTIDQAVAFGDIVLFAIPGPAMDATIASQAAALAGKTIIDAANKVGGPVMNSLAVFAEQVPGAPVFRAFNSLGWENFENPQFGNQPADLFYCGPDGPARPAVEQLIAEIGLSPVWVGGPEQAPLVDSLTRLWFTLANSRGLGRHLAFKMLT